MDLIAGKDLHDVLKAHSIELPECLDCWPARATPCTTRTSTA